MWSKQTAVSKLFCYRFSFIQFEGAMTAWLRNANPANQC